VEHNAMTEPEANILETRLENLRKQVLAEVSQQTTNALSHHQETLLSELKTTISEALQKQQQVVAVRLGTEKEGGGSKLYELVKIMIPVVATALLGLWVFFLQQTTLGKMEEQKQDLGTRLALTQEYQKRKVAIYESCANEMSNLIQGLELMRIDRTNQKLASDSVYALYVCSRNNELYVSSDVAQALSDVRSHAIDDLQNASSQRPKTGVVEKDISKAEDLMRKELLSATADLKPTH
jgi:hypothetical protein